MSQWLDNIVAKKGQPAEWRLMGSIGQWQDINAKDYNTQLSKLERSHSEINMILHSGGGGVYEGLQLYNRTKKSKSTINVDIEGLAASMASALAMAGKHRKMSSISKMMLHQGQDTVSGSGNKLIEAGKQVNECNQTLAEIYAEAIKWKHPDRDANWVMENWLVEGKNKWFSAQDALEAGLVHEVYDSTIKPAPVSASYDELVAFYDNSLTDTHDPEPSIEEGSISNQNSKNNPMKKDKIILMLAGLGITFSDAMTAESSDDSFLDALKGEIKSLKAKADKVKELENQLEALEGETLSAEIDTAIEDGRILEAQRAHYEKLAEVTSNQEVIASLKDIAIPSTEIPLVAVKKKKSTEGSLSKEREAWNLQAWESEDPEGLQELIDSDPEHYTGLVAAYDPEAKSNAVKK